MHAALVVQERPVVGGRARCGPRGQGVVVRAAGLVGRVQGAADHGLRSPANSVDAGVVAERGRRGAGEPVDQPVLAVVVVHREDAVAVRWSRAAVERLLGEQEALQPDLRGAGDQGQRVGQREQDQVVLVVGGLQERPAVVDVPVDPRVLSTAGPGCFSTPICMIRGSMSTASMCLAPLRQRDRDVRARAGADDQHVVQRARPRGARTAPGISAARVSLHSAGPMSWCGTPLTEMSTSGVPLTASCRPRW